MKYCTSWMGLIAGWLLLVAGINSVMCVLPNTAHDWQTWRRSLYEFLPHVFNDLPGKRG